MELMAETTENGDLGAFLMAEARAGAEAFSDAALSGKGPQAEKHIKYLTLLMNLYIKPEIRADEGQKVVAERPVVYVESWAHVQALRGEGTPELKVEGNGLAGAGDAAKS